MNSRYIIPAIAFALTGHGAVEAATISVVGTDFSDTVVREWRTATTAKTLDLDGDNIYGTAGYALLGTSTSTGFQQAFDFSDAVFNDGPIGPLENLVSYPAGVTVSNGWLNLNQTIAGFYGTIDNPEGGPDVQLGIAQRNDFNSGENLGRDGRVALLAIGSDTPGVGDPDATMRLGIILANQPSAGKPNAVRVFSDNDPFYITNFAGDFGASMMFWDVTNYEAGDTVEIWLDALDTSNLIGLSGLTFDVVIAQEVVIPEPASFTLAMMGAGTLLTRRRKGQ